MGMACPADRCSERHGSVQGMPIQKDQQWLANFSLSAFGLRCRNPKALVGASHDHLHARGSMKMPDGKWISVARFTGKYTAPSGALYARSLAHALQRVRTPEKRLRTALSGRLHTGDRAPRRVGRVCTSAARDLRSARGQYVLVAGKPEALDDGAGEVCEAAETQAEITRRQEALRKESKQAGARWKERADAKQWDEVKADLSVT